MKQVNIVMPVHNRWEHTKQSLDSLLENTDPKLCSIWVVDDKSDEENLKNLEDYHHNYHGDHDFRLYRNRDNIGPGASRNFICDAIEKTGNKLQYLYHSDNDVYFKPKWLETLIAVYESCIDDGVKLLGGGCHPYLQNNILLEVFEGSIHCNVGIKDAVSGYSQLMSWDTWKKYGPFDETMRNAEKKIMGSEDWAFCQKIIADGFKVGSIEPEVVIATGKTNTYGEPATGNETFKEVEGVKIA